MQLTAKQYERALMNKLTEKEIGTLLTLYCNQKISTALELSRRLNPLAKGHILASGAIGKIGKTMVNFLELDENKLPTYKNRGREAVAYFSLVGEYDQVNGWMIRGNLKTAISNLILSYLSKTIITNRTH
jgi:hypothetical protein